MSGRKFWFVNPSRSLPTIPLAAYVVESLRAGLLYLTFLAIAIGDLPLFMEAKVDSVEQSSRAI